MLARAFFSSLPLLLFAGCGLTDAFTGEADGVVRTAPDAGAPVGGQDVVEWDGDAAVDAPDAAQPSGDAGALLKDAGSTDG